MSNPPLPPLAALAAALVLGGCGGEPSEVDIRRATETMLTAANDNPFAQMVAGLAGSGNGKIIEIHALRKLGCRKASEANGFVCDVEMDASTFGVRQTRHSSVRMVRGEDGWVAIQQPGALP